ncbi:hypothetical protein BFL43_21310 [Williamsia sp. 1135]|nr:hypothetical protein BFL43_21310 [Williamsia sp. 1135]
MANRLLGHRRRPPERDQGRIRPTPSLHFRARIVNTPPQLPATASRTHLRRIRSVLVAGANLAGADFSSRNIFRTDFTDADLTGASFAGSFHAKLSGTRFEAGVDR